MRVLKPLLAIWLMAGAAAAQELSWSELANRPELWPAQCTVKATIQFDGGVSVQAGQTVDVLDFKGNEADMKTTDDKTYFAAEPDDTDVLDVARAAYAKLTAKQQALTYPMIVQQKELWPYRVTIIRGFNLAPGVAVQALLTVQKAEAEKLAAEEQAKAAEIKAEGRVAVELEGKLINSQTGEPEPLNTNAWPRYIVFLRGQSTCPITRSFAPSFIQYCNSIKSTHPEVEVVYLTIESLPDTFKFAKELGFDWRMVSYENTTMPSVNPIIDGRIPQLIVMDRDGRLLANGIQSTAPAALQQLDALLKQPVN